LTSNGSARQFGSEALKPTTHPAVIRAIWVLLGVGWDQQGGNEQGLVVKLTRRQKQN